ncbi:bactericidal permeability-increasing protein-like isoform X2 [Poecile atricapillus]|uniref:bactericidal permeability-increasing protein-like isoform X2 n=1 Tax=Poecile atricapillus TaxID=48891 RepID=UPI00273A4C84|nr:bactericidal permeability-increasing protein-like isoform X2 [Poecile atricapillus]
MGVQSLAVACGALALCLALTTATNPGFVVRITQAGLDYAHEQGIKILEKELAQLKLPDISGDSRVLRVGKVHYELSRLRLRDFHLPYTRITPISNVGLQVSISNAFAELDGDWRVKFFFVRDHGSFNLKVENVYIKIFLSLGSDATGKPTISTSDCSARISKVRVLFSGRLGWLYNLFHSVIESRLRKILESKVCDNVAKSVQNELQTYIQTLPVTARIDGKIGLDYALVAPPRATAQSLDADLKGEFYSLAHRSTVPFSPPPLALPPDHDRMVYFGASSYFFNTACIAYHKAGALVFEITEAMIPKDVGFKLDTSVFSAFIPQLEEMYPNMPMKFRLSAPTAPFLTIGPGGISFQPIVDAQAYAILPNSSLAPLFLLSLTGNVSAVINVRSGHIVGSLDVGRIRLSLKDSAVGTFQVRMMQSLMNALTSSTLLPHLNARLDEGFPLPLLDRIQLSNTLMKFYQNFMLLGADVHFQPRA